MDEDKQLIRPDWQTLCGIFPGLKDCSPDELGAETDVLDTYIISHTREICTCKVTFRAEIPVGFPKSVIVRLDTDPESIATLRKIEDSVHRQIPELVPQILGSGITVNEKGVRYAYLTSAYVDAVSAEDVWDTLGSEEQKRLMESVVCALKKLQTSKLDGRAILELMTAEQRAFVPKLEPDSNVVGSLDLNFFPTIEALLTSYHKLKNRDTATSTITPTKGGIVVESVSKSYGKVELTEQDLVKLNEQVVFCHNDLEPRNILLRKVTNKDDKQVTQYELAAILQWKMIGALPFSFETAIKDSALGVGNTHYSWYSLFKQQTAHLIQDECHERLIRATRIINDSWLDSLVARKLVDAHFRVRWLEREQVEYSADARQGWVRKPGHGLIEPFTDRMYEELETKIEEELSLR